MPATTPTPSFVSYDSRASALALNTIAGVDPEAAKLLVPGVFTLIVAALALVGALIGAFLSSGVAARNNKQNLFVNTVTAERAKWRAELRTITSELAKVTFVGLSDPKPETLARLHELRVLVRLRLNPSSDPKHALDQAALAALPELTKAVEEAKRSEALSALEKVEAAVQHLLKQEWEKSKREAARGALEP
jgi:hypothetical protein